ncbi:MAG: folate-binding protein YgfZ [Solirubrobacterales bacterium]
MPIEALPELDAQYRVLREETGLIDRSARGKLKLSGAEAAEFLQGQLTNEIEALEPEQGAYAALLNRKGHLRADMRVLRLSPEEIWLDTEPEALEDLRSHLERYKIGRQVKVADVTRDWAIASLIGPASYETAGTGPLTPEHAHRHYRRDGIEILAVATDLGVDLIIRADHAAAVRELLTGSGASPVSEEAAEIVRVESGRPRFGHEMSSSTMPAEAGITQRAVSFTKGCYIGQEPVARLHYKGKPNRHLRGLRLSGPVTAGTPLVLGEKVVGEIGTACVSPARGPIALAVVRREAEPGDTVAAGEDGVTGTLVDDLPFG